MENGWGRLAAAGWGGESPTSPPTVCAQGRMAEMYSYTQGGLVSVMGHDLSPLHSHDIFRRISHVCI